MKNIDYSKLNTRLHTLSATTVGKIVVHAYLFSNFYQRVCIHSIDDQGTALKDVHVYCSKLYRC